MRLAWIAVLLGPCSQAALAQEMDHSQMDHSQMDHGQMDHAAMGHGEMAPAGMAMRAQGSGTSLLPAEEAPSPGLHLMPGGDWMVMLHGFVSGQYSRVSGPRGDEKAYATSMAMAMAEKDFGGAKLTLKSMMSLEPLMEARGYPNLFATGETAGGVPLVDRQHPHDLFMELVARVDVPLGGGTRAFLYGGPVGEPALGPSVFMMRGSAAVNPEPPIAHHWFDSTHITYGVVTAGLAHSGWQLEASAFRGREPDERRWNIETPRLDSWSVRASWTPSPRWVAQLSNGRIKSPEASHEGDEQRTTASVHYGRKGLSAMLGYSAKARHHGPVLDAWLAEATWRFAARNSLFGRVENVKNDELFPDHADPLHEQAFRVSKFQIGYARHIPVGPVSLALGGAVSAFAKPAALDAAYGRAPIGVTLFARVMLGR
jgi:hypothetical protein